LRPDKQLASLLGLSDAGATLSDAFLRVDSTSGPGAGIVDETIQFHGTADRYTLSGATAVATLYSTATSATPNPAVTRRTVGTLGGEAAAFTYDLARSVVYTRQGNPAWAGQERDGVAPIRPDDMFFGGSSPDWVSTQKLHIPQADEQQRLLANLVHSMTRDSMPLPRLWYFPRDLSAAVVMTGDDHAVGGTAARFEQYKAASPAGCSVANWECIRGTSYLYPSAPLTAAQATAYQAEGFELALHPTTTGGFSCNNWTPALLESTFTSQLAAFASEYPGVATPVTSRTHCVSWSDWSTQPTVERAHGIRLDTNYYHFPAAWIGAIPGFMTGSGYPMRFAAIDGTQIGVYQAHTHMNDEASQAYPATANALLDRAIGPEGYYGFFTVNMHTDQASSPGSDAIVASAKARGVPVITAKQLLDWVEGREASRFRNFSWSSGTLRFTLTADARAVGLRAMLPMTHSSGTLSTITRGGTPVAFTVRTIKGVAYAIFPGLSGDYAATFG
jgi:hypothetical protein